MGKESPVNPGSGDVEEAEDEIEGGDTNLSDQDVDEVAGGGGCLKPLHTSGCTGH
ncbi:MAG TPA: hypothetical protein VKY74_24305 [Chloroflexia bacterium]|nr:hypothetical protein [Chloroflexia bacterium]